MPKRTVWTDEMITKLKELRLQGYTYAECAKALGIGQSVAHKKGRELGLPIRMSYSRYSGKVMARAERMEPAEVPVAQRRIAPALRPLRVGEHTTFPVWSPGENKRLHKLVSKYGMAHDLGFRGRVNEDGTVLTVTRVR